MKFLIDAQLPMRLARILQVAGYDTVHTLDSPQKNATPDTEINLISIDENRVVITKDRDFLDSFLIRQQPYKLLLITTGNISNIAEKLGKNPKGVETDLCATLYRYIKSLLDKCDERIENWRNISEWLDAAGYKCQSPSEVPLESLLPEKTVFNVNNIHIENHQLVVVFTLKIPTSKGAEFSISNLDLGDEGFKV